MNIFWIIALFPLWFSSAPTSVLNETVLIAVTEPSIDANDKAKMGDVAYNEYQEGIPLTIERVVELTKKGIEPEKIVFMMKKTESVYCDLTRRDVKRMRRAGVDPKVIKYMKHSCDP